MEILPGASSHQRDQKRIRVAKLKERRNKFKAIMMYKTINGMAPKYMEDMFSQHAGYLAYSLRASCKNVALPQAKTDYYRNSLPSLEPNCGTLYPTT